jgi:hypothetical protein
MIICRLDGWVHITTYALYIQKLKQGLHHPPPAFHSTGVKLFLCSVHKESGTTHVRFIPGCFNRPEFPKVLEGFCNF